jgi:hypothetical protein
VNTRKEERNKRIGIAAKIYGIGCMSDGDTIQKRALLNVMLLPVNHVEYAGSKDCSDTIASGSKKSYLYCYNAMEELIEDERCADMSDIDLYIMDGAAQQSGDYATLVNKRAGNYAQNASHLWKRCIYSLYEEIS